MDPPAALIASTVMRHQVAQGGSDGSGVGPRSALGRLIQRVSGENEVIFIG